MDLKTLFSINLIWGKVRALHNLPMCRCAYTNGPMCRCANYSKFKKSIWNINTEVEYHEPKVLYFFSFDKNHLFFDKIMVLVSVLLHFTLQFPGKVFLPESEVVINK